MIAGAEHDQLVVAGEASLDGTLLVSFLDNFTPTAGDAFEILTAGDGVRGAYATELLPALVDGKRWRVDYNPTSVVLEVLPALEADFDEDGNVDGDDLVRWKAGFGAGGSATHMQGDADGNAYVDGADCLTWQRQLGSGIEAHVTSRHIPEPVAVTLAFFASCGLAICRSQRRWAAFESFV